MGIENFNKTNSVEFITLSAQQTKTIDFQVTKSNETIFGTITLSSSDMEYQIPVEIFPVPGTSSFCGNGIIDSVEECDGDEWGNITGCSNFDFNSGSLSCNPPGTIEECTFDINNCFDTSGGNEECVYDFECGFNEECLNDQCVEEVECRRNSDCDSDDDCVDNECVPEDRECIKDNECKSDEECVRWECVPEENRECDRNYDCGSNKECVQGECVVKITPETQKTCDDLGGEICALDKICGGEFQNVGNNVCCLGLCKEKNPGFGSSKVIGWSLLGFIILFLAFFYIKYKKKKTKKPDLVKISGLK